ncbi:MAG TPA: transcriptional antiterminator [Desulfobacteraceae bacterium]|nr:transcriptional antiterminator [Desulfobacteraceae bacterium]
MNSDKLIYTWYALRTRSRFEDKVHAALLKKTFKTFLPKVLVKSKRRDRNKMIRVPLFPGYLFVKTNLDPHEHVEILKTTGAVRLIGNSTGAIPVENGKIDSLKIMVEATDSVSTGKMIQEGEAVLVVRGPFSGVTCLFLRYKGQGRVVASINALGQSAFVEIEEEDIEYSPFFESKKQMDIYRY